MSWWRKSGTRWMRRRPWQAGLSLLGIALAVAVVTGVDLANGSAKRAFQASVDGVAGKATHEIVGGPRGIEEALYTDLRLRGLRPSAPVVEGWVQGPDRALFLLGVDPFAEIELRSFSRNWSGQGTGNPYADFTQQPGSMVTTPELAEELGLQIGDSLTIQVAGRDEQLTLIATLSGAQDLDRQSAQDLLISDVSTAQEVLRMAGRLSRVDLRLEEDSGPQLEDWQAALPADVQLQSKASRSDVLDQMTSAFRLNLQALSLLALLVGMFLIYNTMSFAVVEQRGMLGNLRVLGVTRRQIFAYILAQALVLGVLASVLGLALGFFIAQGLLSLVTQTINDLYFVLSVGDLELGPLALLKGFALGTLGTVLATLRPAYEAMSTPPRQVMQRSSLEARTRHALPQRTLLGLGGLLLTGLLLLIPSTSLALGFGVLLLFILSCAVLIPPAIWAAMRGLDPPARRLGLLASMAVRGVAASLSRTGVATAALVVAVAMTLGVALMVSSFRSTLSAWLHTTLEADVYVAPVDFASRGDRQPFDPELLERLLTTPGIDSVSSGRRVDVPCRQGLCQLFALDMDRRAFGRFDFISGIGGGDPDAIWQAFLDGGALISEPMAHHRQLKVGDSLEMLTADGWHTFPVQGIYYDYGSDRGVATLHRATYDRLWRDPEVHTLAIYADPELGSAGLIDNLRQTAEGYPLMITANDALRDYSLAVFDRTFAITQVLRLLALGVAFLGILSALMALQLERRKELAVLRAQGLTPRQLARQVVTQTGLMGVVAGVLSLPLGVALSVLLIDVINRRAFGWTLRLELDPGSMTASFVLALLAALLAGAYPAWRLARISPALALREE